MGVQDKTIIEKLKIIGEMAQNPETTQVTKVVIEYIENNTKSDSLGFQPKKGK